MLSKNLDAIEVAALQALVANGVSERQTIDYKSQLPGTTDADKKEFLADAFSFANTAGGDLLYGIREENGAPIAIHGVEVSNFDALKLEWENRLRDGVQPRLPAVDLRAAALSGGRAVVIVRVRKSWDGPL